MGRDDHFVSRLGRFDDASAALAIELFRHRWILDETIARAAEEGSSRVMLSMDDCACGSRIVAATDGHFVTCLARGFAHGPWPLIDRARIEQVRVAYWRSHARWATGRDDARWAEVLRVIEHCGGALEDGPRATVARMVEHDALGAENLRRWYGARWRAAIVFLARRPEGFVLQHRQRFELWSASWALVHLQRTMEGAPLDARAWRDGDAREHERAREMVQCEAVARRSAAALRAQINSKKSGNERCECGCGRRARRCVSITGSGEWAIAS